MDSRAVVERTWLRWTQRHGLVIPDIVSRAHGRRSVDTLRDIAPLLPVAEEVAWLEAVELSDTDGLVILPGAREAISSLGDDRRAIVTSGGRELARMRLRAMGLDEPQVLIAAEDVQAGKPSPEGYACAADRLGFPPGDCLVIEDTPAGIDSGHAAGARVLALATTFPVEALTNADRIVPTLAQVRISLDDAGIWIR